MEWLLDYPFKRTGDLFWENGRWSTELDVGTVARLPEVPNPSSSPPGVRSVGVDAPLCGFVIGDMWIELEVFANVGCCHESELLCLVDGVPH